MATRSRSASRSATCASTRARCKSGASRCGVPSTRAAAGVVSLFGRLTGLDHLHAGHRLEVRPFGLGRVRHRDSDAAGGLAHGTDEQLSAGIDAKAHLTPELTLDLAVLPDFGQVEADTLILNLSTYET